MSITLKTVLLFDCPFSGACNGIIKQVSEVKMLVYHQRIYAAMRDNLF